MSGCFIEAAGVVFEKNCVALNILNSFKIQLNMELLQPFSGGRKVLENDLNVEIVQFRTKFHSRMVVNLVFLKDHKLH